MECIRCEVNRKVGAGRNEKALLDCESQVDGRVLPKVVRGQDTVVTNNRLASMVLKQVLETHGERLAKLGCTANVVG
jgi:hypothetical protein